MTMGGGTCGVLNPPPPPAGAEAGRGGGGGRGNPWNCAGTPNPGGLETSIWMEEVSWMGVRDHLKAGKTTVIQPVGGLAPGGPYLTLGHRNVLLQADCEALARKLGNAQCGPTFEISVATDGEQQTPGVMTMRESTFRNMLLDVVMGHRVHGFKEIVLIGNSPATQATMKALADSLTGAWRNGSRVLYVAEYFKAPAGTPKVVTAAQKEEGLVDDVETTLAMMTVNPASVRHAERVQTRQATVDGVSINDLTRSLTLGKSVVDAKATRLAALIRQRTAVPPRK
jgi:creatinine amidohydrolase